MHIIFWHLRGSVLWNCPPGWDGKTVTYASMLTCANSKCGTFTEWLNYLKIVAVQKTVQRCTRRWSWTEYQPNQLSFRFLVAHSQNFVIMPRLQIPKRQKKNIPVHTWSCRSYWLGLVSLLELDKANRDFQGCTPYPEARESHQLMAWLY